MMLNQVPHGTQTDMMTTTGTMIINGTVNVNISIEAKVAAEAPVMNGDTVVIRKNIDDTVQVTVEARRGIGDVRRVEIDEENEAHRIGEVHRIVEAVHHHTKEDQKVHRIGAETIGNTTENVIINPVNMVEAVISSATLKRNTTWTIKENQTTGTAVRASSRKSIIGRKIVTSHPHHRIDTQIQ